jgi:diadenosine tetraphosphate (Ap4A) HIT family hydrolase
MAARIDGDEGADGQNSPTLSFHLDSRLAATSRPLADLPLCQARLQSDARWPWIVLVPRRPGLTELDQLSAEDLSRLMAEVVAAGRAVRAMATAAGRPVDKLNVGALGNIVAQLHVHVVGRRTDDPAWPGPVWGQGEAEAHTPETRALLLTAARVALGFAA